MSLSSSSSNTPAGGTPVKQQQYRSRMPLSELPIANYIVRSSSPTKSQSSPTKVASSNLLPSPKLVRPSINRSSDLAAFDKRLNIQGETLRSGSTSPISPRRQGSGGSVGGGGGGEGSSSESCDENSKRSSPFLMNSGSSIPTGTSLADLPLEESPVISDEITHMKSSPASNLRKLRHAKAKANAATVPKSPIAPVLRSNKQNTLQSSTKKEEKNRLKAIEQQTEGEHQWRPEDLVTPPLQQDESGDSFGGNSTLSVRKPPVVPQSLPRKKDRVKPSEIAHLLMDQDEDQSALDRGSPSPHKSAMINAGTNSSNNIKSIEKDSPSMLTSRTDLTKPNDGFAVPKSVANKGLAIGLGIDHPLNVGSSTVNTNPVSWTVLPDSDQENQQAENVENSTFSQANFDNTPEADKENAKPDPVILRGRKKGTGGRLSLVATAAQAEDGNTSNEITTA